MPALEECPARREMADSGWADHPSAVDRSTAEAAAEGVGHHRSSETREGGIFSRLSEVLKGGRG